MSLFVKQSLQNENALSLNTNKAVVNQRSPTPITFVDTNGDIKLQVKKGSGGHKSL